MAKSTNKSLSQSSNSSAGPRYATVDDDIEIADEEEEPPEPIQILQEKSTFDKIVVWGHDAIPSNEDPFVKGIEEWISFAEAIHATPRIDEGHINSTAAEAGPPHEP